MITPTTSNGETISSLTDKPPIFVRYVHQKTNLVMVKLSAGGVYATKQTELITTVLGSCVAVCLRNTATGCGGINHYMLPEGFEATENDEEEKKFRYGELAIPELVSIVLTDGGCLADLEAKIFGGADVLNTGSSVGINNISCAFDVLSQYGIHVAASDTGLQHPRKIIYNPLSGAVQLKRLRSTYQGMIVARERTYMDSLSNRASATSLRG